MKSQVLHTVWCNISGEAAGEIGDWSLLGVKGLNAFVATLVVNKKSGTCTGGEISSPLSLSGIPIWYFRPGHCIVSHRARITSHLVILWSLVDQVLCVIVLSVLFPGGAPNYFPNSFSGPADDCVKLAPHKAQVTTEDGGGEGWGVGERGRGEGWCPGGRGEGMGARRKSCSRLSLLWKWWFYSQV